MGRWPGGATPSIRALAEVTGRSYGSAHCLLTDAGVAFRSWGSREGGVVTRLPSHRTKVGVVLGARGPSCEGPFGRWADDGRSADERMVDEADDGTGPKPTHRRYPARAFRT
ncbi:helix-turn-helix domain-containing protein [Streptomyces noursei]|uniref:helix-turn-helix domain-containing protein n=1 Tax=Streptomyces noursei TaxID=1971 RepID=UPI0037AACA7C